MIDQSILAAFPIVGLSIIVSVVAIYLLYKERREGQSQNHTRKD